MKTLLLVTKWKSVQESYFSELHKVFGGYLNILPCQQPEEGQDFSQDSGIAQADLVLITNPYSFPHARRQMRPDAQIINLDIAFDKEKVEGLKRFPVGTETLACFEFYSVGHQAVNHLYAAGITNLNLNIYYPGNQNLVGKRLDLALIASTTSQIPEGIAHTYHLGDLKLSLTTLLDIAVKGNILNDRLEAAIAAYCDTISTPMSHISYFYDTSAATAIQLKAIMGCIDYAIVIYDQSGRIISFNPNFASLFGLTTDLYGRMLQDMPWEGDMDRVVRSEAECENRLCSYQGRSFTVSQKLVNKGDGGKNLYILLIKDITELTNLETSLRKQIAKRGHVAKYTFEDIKGDSPAMVRCVTKARRIACIDKPTLIMGESGTGKELFAQSIHNASHRAKFPFVAMNCAAIPSALLESELFGYDEGAFTGAKRGGKEGLFQMAHKGTLFLDEIGEMSLPTQAKLLRVLEEKEIMKVGSGELTGVDVRIVAATNRNLKALVSAGEFRLDLYYRLNTLIINVPPLRERQSDIPLLMAEFLRHEHPGPVAWDPEVQAFLLRYPWEGNIRELRNCVEYMVNITQGRMTAEDLPDYMLESFECRHATPLQETERSPLPGETDRELLLAALCLLQKRSMGRYQMRTALAESGFLISDYQLKALLRRLSGAGVVLSTPGRRGCVLTEHGRQLLAALTKPV